MALAVCSCLCGSTDSLIRTFLHSAKYKDYLSIPVEKGRDRSFALLNSLPPYPELDMLRGYLKEIGKWAVIIGYDGEKCRWSDIAHGGDKTRIEATFLVEEFA